MSVTFMDVPDRQTLAGHANNDFQPWKGFGKDGNALACSTRLTALKRTRCIVDQAANFIRKTQGKSFTGHFPQAGTPVIATADIGQVLKLNFDNPVTAVGFEVEPVPANVVPNQPYRVFLTMNCVDGNQEVFAPKTGSVGNCLFVGTQGDPDSISGMELNVRMVETNGQETPVNFGINRLELLVSPH